MGQLKKNFSMFKKDMAIYTDDGADIAKHFISGMGLLVDPTNTSGPLPKTHYVNKNGYFVVGSSPNYTQILRAQAPSNQWAVGWSDGTNIEIIPEVEQANLRERVKTLIRILEDIL